MTCHEARERYSALVDDALDAGERGAVEAHVAGCAECRRELERFRRTVALMQGAGPVRAPAGFVDRVLEAAAPTPWYRRLARALFSPLGVKLPLEAAAMLLVAGIAVYVFQQSPELQQAARHEAPPVSYSEPPSATVAPPPAPAAPPAAPVPPPSVALPPGAGRVGPPATQPAPPAAVGPEKSPAPSSGAGSARPSAPASEQSAKGARPGRSSDAAKSAGRKPDAQGAAPAPGPSAPAGPFEAANRARAESPRQDGADASGRTDQASSVAKKIDESSRERSAAEGKPAESRAPETRTGEVRAKEAERRAEGKGGGARPERATEPAAPPARERVLPSVLSDPPAGERQGALAREDKSGAAPPPAAAPAPLPMMKSAPASPPASASDARVQARPQLRQETAAALAPGADVAARLAVPDRAAALRALAELLARAGGREVARRADADADAVDLLVPRERYTDFLQSLAQVGRLSLDREPGTMPGQVRVVLRIVHGGS